MRRDIAATSLPKFVSVAAHLAPPMLWQDAWSTNVS